MSPAMSAPKNRVFFFSHPRTASNLLVRLLSDQEGWSYNEYNFLDAYIYAVRNFDHEDPSEEKCAAYSAMTTTAYEKLQDFLSTASKEQAHAFTKDHALMLLRPEILNPSLQFPFLPTTEEPHTNPTLLPDSLLSTFQPLLVIRHPALVFSSLLRVSQKTRNPLTELSTSFLPQLKVYEWYKSHTSLEPIIVEADDIIDNSSIVAKVCEVLGMDSSCIKREWDEMEEKKKQELPPNVQLFLGTMLSSKGILKGKSSKDVNFDGLKEGWKEEFGVDMAKWLEERVGAAMGDYEFLRSVRVV